MPDTAASSAATPGPADDLVPERLGDGWTWRWEGYVISTDPARLDLEFVVAQLSGAYWAHGRSRTTIERSIRHSIPFGVFAGDGQVGFARVVSDRATFAWVCDVIIAPAARGRGLGTWLLRCIDAHPELQDLRRWLLATRDAHGLYRKVGYAPLPEPDRWMQRLVEAPLPPEDPA